MDNGICNRRSLFTTLEVRLREFKSHYGKLIINCDSQTPNADVDHIWNNLQANSAKPQKQSCLPQANSTILDDLLIYLYLLIGYAPESFKVAVNKPLLFKPTPDQKAFPSI